MIQCRQCRSRWFHFKVSTRLRVPGQLNPAKLTLPYTLPIEYRLHVAQPLQRSRYERLLCRLRIPETGAWKIMKLNESARSGQG